VSRFTEKQLVLMTVGAAALLAAGLGVMTWLDYQAVYRNEVTEQNPGAADVTDEAEWGEHRKIWEIKKQMEAAQAEASLIGKREQDVIVYREIVARDAAILPEVDDVNKLADTIDGYVKQSGVSLRQVSDLSIHPGGEAIKTMPIKLSIAGSFDQFLKFLNLFENLDRIINVRGFSVTGGKAAPGARDKKASHDIQLDLVTYIYSPSAGIAKPVDIANYEHRKDDPTILRLVRQQKPARVDKYQLKPRINRRDPLVEARKPGGADAAAGDPADVQQQRERVDKLKFDLEVLKADVQQEEQFVAEKKYVPLATLKPMIDAKCGKLDAEIAAALPGITASELREAFNDDVVAPFESIKGRRKLVTLPVVFSAAEAAKFLEKMKTGIDARKYEQVVKTLADFEALVKNQTVAEDAMPIVADMRGVAKEAHAMLSFEALHLHVDGLVLQGAGSIVLISHKSYKVGDAVDPAGRCKLKEILQNKLVFELDGLEIEHELNKK
jgi:Tfp pilus assembly protein PilO